MLGWVWAITFPQKPAQIHVREKKWRDIILFSILREKWKKPKILTRTEKKQKIVSFLRLEK